MKKRSLLTLIFFILSLSPSAFAEEQQNGFKETAQKVAGMIFLAPIIIVAVPLTLFISSSEPAHRPPDSNKKIELEPLKEDYLAADKLLHESEYKQALQLYKKFIAENSKDKFVVAAQYRIGECYLALRNCDAAFKQFSMIGSTYPPSVWTQYADSAKKRFRCV